jgi:hypothetical protein
MTMLNTSTSWNVGRVSGRCAACSAELPPNTACWAALCDAGRALRAAPGAHSPEFDHAKPSKGEPHPSPFFRVDFCESCWDKGRRPEELSPAALGLETASSESAPPQLAMFSFWKTTVPFPQQKKKLLVDDSVLLDVFSRMEGRTEPQEIRFRFVLALILMRKRLLKYEGMEDPLAPPTGSHDPAAPKPVETWRMIPKIPDPTGAPGGTWAPSPVHVINPHLTAEQITEVSQQLSAILAEEV